LLELAKAARGGQRTHELKARAGELFDFVFKHQLNALLMASMRAEKIDALVQALDPARARDAAEAVAETLVPVLLQVLLGGEAQDENVQRILFEPYVPLAEEVLLALGRTRDPLAQELLLPALHGAGELRAHACLALGMCGVIGASEPLLPVLLDEDPFVRFCAAESLRHLWGQEHALDWTSATGAERAAAAEELRQKWLARER
jgi:HEAT repeat protein